MTSITTEKDMPIPLYRPYAELESENEQLRAFIYKIAEGHRLRLRSFMTGNQVCTICKSEAKISDNIEHKPWCLVLAARQFLPGFTIPPDPLDVEAYRRYGNEDDPRFAWSGPDDILQVAYPFSTLLMELHNLPSPYSDMYRSSQGEQALREKLALYGLDIEWDDNMERYILFYINNRR